MRVWHVQVRKKYIFQLYVSKHSLILRADPNKNGGYLERSEKYRGDCEETIGDIIVVVYVDFATDYITIEDVGVFGGVFLRTNTKLLPTFNFALPIRVNRQNSTANCKNVKVHIPSTILTP